MQVFLKVFLFFLIVEVVLILLLLLFTLMSQLLVESSIQLRQNLLVRISELGVSIINKLDRLTLILASVLILTNILVLVNLAIILPDQVFQRILLLLRICHWLRRCKLHLLLTFLQGGLSLHVARFVTFRPSKPSLRCLFQVLATTFDFHQVFGTFLRIIGFARFGPREISITRPVFRGSSLCS